MTSFASPDRNRRIATSVIAAVVGLTTLSVTAGCSKRQDEKQADAEMRKAFSDKGKKFEDLPPAQQAMVRAMMGGNPGSKPGGGGASSGSTTSAPAAPAKK